MSSPSRSVASSNAPDAETSRICEICDRTDGVVEDWQQGTRAHSACVPATWRKDRADLEAFMAAMHRIHYRLTEDGKVEADCLKCDWWMTDWPNGVGDMYRKAQRHVKGERDSS